LCGVVAVRVRVSIFIVYLVLISLLPDLRRVFQYHAAEHKAINAYEAGEELEPESVQRHRPRHPPCGTAVLLCSSPTRATTGRSPRRRRGRSSNRRPCSATA